MTNEEIANNVCEKYQKSIIPTEEECLAYSSAMEALELKEQRLLCSSTTESYFKTTSREEEN